MSLRVGYIGLGRMGRPMALNILKGGFPLNVYNRTPSKMEELVAQGATPTSSPRELAAASDVVCTCVSMPADVEEVILGLERGVIAGARPGSVVVDFSTVGPKTAQKVAAALAERGVGFVDAPVSGGPPGAAAGTLTVMCGGAREHFERVLPVLQCVGRKIVHAGPPGAGAVVKLVNQLLVSTNLAVACEGMVLGAKYGVDPRVLLDAVSASSGASAALTRNFTLILHGKFDPLFALNLMYKDLNLAAEMGREAGVRLLLGHLALQVYEEAFAAVIKPLERLAGVEVRAPAG